MVSLGHKTGVVGDFVGGGEVSGSHGGFAVEGGPAGGEVDRL